MAVLFQTKKFKGDFPAIWRGECKVLPGGFAPVQTLATGTVVYRGTPLCVDFDNMQAAIVKVAKVVSGGTTTKPRVSKGSYFAVGDTVFKIGNDASGKTISAIDTSNDDYDVLTLSGAITGLVADDFLQEAVIEQVTTGEGTAQTTTNVASAKYVANAVVASDLEIKGMGIPTLDAAYEAVILKNVAAPIPPAWLDGYCLATNHNIIYIKQ